MRDGLLTILAAADEIERRTSHSSCLGHPESWDLPSFIDSDCLAHPLHHHGASHKRARADQSASLGSKATADAHPPSHKRVSVAGMDLPTPPHLSHPRWQAHRAHGNAQACAPKRGLTERQQYPSHMPAAPAPFMISRRVSVDFTMPGAEAMRPGTPAAEAFTACDRLPIAHGAPGAGAAAVGYGYGWPVQQPQQPFSPAAETATAGVCPTRTRCTGSTDACASYAPFAAAAAAAQSTEPAGVMAGRGAANAAQGSAHCRPFPAARRSSTGTALGLGLPAHPNALPSPPLFAPPTPTLSGGPEAGPLLLCRTSSTAVAPCRCCAAPAPPLAAPLAARDEAPPAGSAAPLIAPCMLAAAANGGSVAATAASAPVMRCFRRSTGGAPPGADVAYTFDTSSAGVTSAAVSASAAGGSTDADADPQPALPAPRPPPPLSSPPRSPVCDDHTAWCCTHAPCIVRQAMHATHGPALRGRSVSAPGSGAELAGELPRPGQAPPRASGMLPPPPPLQPPRHVPRLMVPIVEGRVIRTASLPPGIRLAAAAASAAAESVAGTQREQLNQQQQEQLRRRSLGAAAGHHYFEQPEQQLQRPYGRGQACERRFFAAAAPPPPFPTAEQRMWPAAGCGPHAYVMRRRWSVCAAPPPLPPPSAAPEAADHDTGAAGPLRRASYAHPHQPYHPYHPYLYHPYRHPAYVHCGAPAATAGEANDSGGAAGHACPHPGFGFVRVHRYSFSAPPPGPVQLPCAPAQAPRADPADTPSIPGHQAAPDVAAPAGAAAAIAAAAAAAAIDPALFREAFRRASLEAAALRADSRHQHQQPPQRAVSPTTADSSTGSSLQLRRESSWPAASGASGSALLPGCNDAAGGALTAAAPAQRQYSSVQQVAELPRQPAEASGAPAPVRPAPVTEGAKAAEAAGVAAGPAAASVRAPGAFAGVVERLSDLKLRL